MTNNETTIRIRLPTDLMELLQVHEGDISLKGFEFIGGNIIRVTVYSARENRTDGPERYGLETGEYCVLIEGLE